MPRSYMRRRAAGSTTVAFAILTLALSACGSDEDGDGGGGGGGEERSIEVNMYSRELPYFQEIVDGVQAKADELGWSVEVTFGRTDPELQFSQVQNAITKQPDGIIMSPVDREGLVPVVQEASETDIDVITVADDLSAEGREFELAYVGVQYEDLGRQKAQFIVDQLGGEGTVGFIHGIRGLHFTEAQDDGATEVFEENPGIEVIDGPYTGAFSTETGLDATQNLLTRSPNIDALYFDNDDIAIGGIEAAKERGIAMDDILIIGTDGGPPALDAVKKSELDYTISLCGYATGLTAVEVLQSALDGETPEKFVPIETQAFTPDNIEKKLSNLSREDC